VRLASSLKATSCKWLSQSSGDCQSSRSWASFAACPKEYSAVSDKDAAIEGGTIDVWWIVHDG